MVEYGKGEREINKERSVCVSFECYNLNEMNKSNSFLSFFSHTKSKLQLKMPFKSDAQRRLCFALADQAQKKGKKPKWDCHKFAREPTAAKKKRKSVTIKKLPEKLKKIWNARTKKYKTVKLFKGAKGGLYYKKNGKKIYV